ncbi:6-phosphofructokinase [uncultured Eubacterium sp.]|mgnify:FL=1|uniref:6-phosphofructokinase n=1 Tax=uncultured Eubacterium sp. TaxID=165185 RepID=UPI0025852AA2|nr:6-phosphofructokinase [uncultured Eubacterium sp.]
MNKKNMIIGQSGGPTAVINSSLAGAISCAFAQEKIGTVYGMINGIEGFFNEHLIDLNSVFENKPYMMNSLKHSPAMYLGSCRYKLSGSQEEFEKAFELLEKYNIGYFFYIGGNDSMDTVKQMSEYAKKINSDVRFVGIPKTIDNDLVGIDHSPGFGSAAKYIASCVREVAYDTTIYNIKSIHIIEAMGRDAGWIAGSAALAKEGTALAPHLIYLPEVAFSTEQFLKDVNNMLEKYNSVIVVVSEGIRDKDGNYISAEASNTDKFGHIMLSGVGAYLKSVIENKIGCKVRALEPGVLQRSAAHIASHTDMNEAFSLGEVAVKAAVDGQTGVFSTIRRTSDSPYCVEYGTEDVRVVANAVKTVPREWINAEGNYVTEEFLNYVRPLVVGIPQVPYRNGLPDYIDVRHLNTKEQRYTE